MKELRSEDFIVTNSVKLDQIPTSLNSSLTKKEKKKALKHVGRKLSKMQDVSIRKNIENYKEKLSKKDI